jgi:hypothetical protein
MASNCGGAFRTVAKQRLCAAIEGEGGSHPLKMKTADGFARRVCNGVRNSLNGL